MWLWEKLLNERPEVKTIIEIGTKHGGFSLYLLAQALQRGLSFWTCDIKDYGWAKEPLAKLFDLGKYFICGDVFAEDGKKLKHLLEKTQDIHPLILLCDGGQKELEFKMFVPSLRAGDIVGAHDWNREFWPHSVEPVKDMVEPIMWAECEALDSWTRFWRRK